MTRMKYALIAAFAAFAGSLGSAQALPAALAAGGGQQTAANAKSGIVQVRRGGGHHFHGGRHHFRGGVFPQRFHHRHWGGPRFRYWGPTIGIYGGYYNRCGWLHQRAIYTGSRYWWRRYDACRYGW